MAERIGTIEDRRSRRTEPREGSPPSEQVPNERLATRDELVREDIPGSCFESTVPDECRERGHAIGANGRVVVDEDGLPIEEKARRAIWRLVQELVDERDKALAKALEGVIPLPVPVGVRDDVNVERHRSWSDVESNDKRPRRYFAAAVGRAQVRAVR
jgi:hypothetical protein